MHRNFNFAPSVMRAATDRASCPDMATPCCSTSFEMHVCCIDRWSGSDVHVLNFPSVRFVSSLKYQYLVREWEYIFFLKINKKEKEYM